MTDRPLPHASGARGIPRLPPRIWSSREARAGAPGFRSAPSGVRIKHNATGPTRYQPARDPGPAYAVRTRDVVALHTSGHDAVCRPVNPCDLSAGSGARRRWRTTMEIAVIGSTGRIGSRVVHRLLDSGYRVVAATPSAGADTITARELSEALARVSTSCST